MYLRVIIVQLICLKASARSLWPVPRRERISNLTLQYLDNQLFRTECFSVGLRFSLQYLPAEGFSDIAQICTGAFWTAAAFSSSQGPKQTWTGALSASAKSHTKHAAVSRAIMTWKSAPVLQKLRVLPDSVTSNTMMKTKAGSFISSPTKRLGQLQT